MDRIKCYDVNGNVIEHLVQWDKNQQIYIEDLVSGIVPEVHFGKDDNPICYQYKNTISSSNGKYIITIPNELLQDSFRLYVYLYYKSNNSYTTKYYVPILIIAKPKPDGYTLEDNIEKVPVTQILTDLSELQEDINTLHSSIGTLQLNIQILQSDAGTLKTNVNTLQNSLNNKLTTPSRGAVGQILEIASVDANGKPLTFIAVDKPTGGTSSLGKPDLVDDGEGNVSLIYSSSGQEIVFNDDGNGNVTF